MTYKGIIKKSRTFDFTALVIAFGLLEQHLPLVRENLGDYYGIVFIVVAIIYGVLRQKTTGPVGEK